MAKRTKHFSLQGKIVTLDVKPVSQNWMTGKNKDNCPGCITGDEHPLWKDSDMINFIKGDITRKDIQQQVEVFVNKAKTVLVVEDASHRYPETLTRMNAAFKYVTVGSYMLVQDTKMDRFVSRLRKKYGNLKFGPMRSVDEFIKYVGGFFFCVLMMLRGSTATAHFVSALSDGADEDSLCPVSGSTSYHKSLPSPLPLRELAFFWFRRTTLAVKCWPASFLPFLATRVPTIVYCTTTPCSRTVIRFGVSNVCASLSPFLANLLLSTTMTGAKRSPVSCCVPSVPQNIFLSV